MQEITFEKNPNKTAGTLNFLNHRSMEDMSGVSLNQKLPHSSVPNKDLPSLDQNQHLERKGRTSTRNDCLFQQVSNESYSLSSGKAEIKRSIAKRQVGLNPTGETQSVPKGYAATLKGKQTKHGDSEAIWMGQKGKKNPPSVAGRLTMLCFHFQSGE